MLRISGRSLICRGPAPDKKTLSKIGCISKCVRGRMPLTQAQKTISRDWYAAYLKMEGRD